VSLQVSFAEFGRDFKRIHTFSWQSKDLSLQNDGGQAKEINRLSCDINQMVEINSNHIYPSSA
jgi:hypothetical protein